MVQEKKYKFPGFKCPNPICRAKNVAFAANKSAYNKSKIILLKDAPEEICADYIVICPKCKLHLIIWDQSMVRIPTIVEECN